MPWIKHYKQPKRAVARELPIVTAQKTRDPDPSSHSQKPWRVEGRDLAGKLYCHCSTRKQARLVVEAFRREGIVDIKMWQWDKIGKQYVSVANVAD